MAARAPPQHQTTPRGAHPGAPHALASSRGQHRRERRGPDRVARRRQVQCIRHQGAVDRPIGLDEARAAVDPAHLRVVLERGLQRLVDLQQVAAHRVDALATGEDRHERERRFRHLSADGAGDRRHAGERALGIVMLVAEVVGPDQQHDDLGCQPRERCLRQAPQHMLGPVAAHAEVHRAQRRDGPVPRRPAAIFPALRDAVAHEDHGSRRGRPRALEHELLARQDALLVSRHRGERWPIDWAGSEPEGCGETGQHGAGRGKRHGHTVIQVRPSAHQRQRTGHGARPLVR